MMLQPGRAEAQAPAAAPGAAPPGADRPADEMLRTVETEGHRIASYREAIDKARDRAREKNPDLLEDTRTVVVNRSGSLHVVFLRQVITASVTKGLMAVADAVFNPRAGDLSAFQAFDPPRVSPGGAEADPPGVERHRVRPGGDRSLQRPVARLGGRCCDEREHEQGEDGRRLEAGRRP